MQYDPRRDRYEIGKVVSVNESPIGVNNDPYTNATAKKDLELAIETAKALVLSADPKWAEIARKLYLPETAMMLIDYPLEFPLTANQKRKIADAALSHPPRTP